MTDNEIIKALECLMHDNCEDCPYYRDDCADRIKDPIELSKYSLDLIKRQQAEIEKLQKENDELRKAIAGAYELNCFLEATRKIVRVEAIKEFAERLNNETFKVDYAGSIYNVVDVDDVDNLAKEMVGEWYGKIQG